MEYSNLYRYDEGARTSPLSPRSLSNLVARKQRFTGIPHVPLVDLGFNGLFPPEEDGQLSCLRPSVPTCNGPNASPVAA